MILKKYWSAFVVKLAVKLCSRLSEEEKVQLLRESGIGFRTFPVDAEWFSAYRMNWETYHD